MTRLELTAEAERLLRSDMSGPEVAALLGIDRSTVLRHRRRLGVCTVRTVAPLRRAIPPPSSGDTMPAPCHPEPALSEECWRVLFVPDTHAPYHCRRAWSVMMAAARWLRPHCIVVLGDFIDCYSISRYPKSVSRMLRWDDEITSARDLLDDLDSLGAQSKHYIMGNHEWRWERYISERCPDIARSLPDVGAQLGLPARGWSAVPYRDGVTIGNVYCTHDLDRHGVTAIRRAGEELRANVVIGHVHKVGLHVLGGRGHGPATQAACFGWLGDVELIDYAARERARREYQLGFGVGYVEPDGTTHLEPVPIIGGAACVSGRIVRAA